MGATEAKEVRIHKPTVAEDFDGAGIMDATHQCTSPHSVAMSWLDGTMLARQQSGKRNTGVGTTESKHGHGETVTEHEILDGYDPMGMEEHDIRPSASQSMQKEDSRKADFKYEEDFVELDVLIEDWIERIKSCIRSHKGKCTLILPLEEDESIQVYVDCDSKEGLKNDLEKLDQIAGWRIEMHPAQRNSTQFLMNAGASDSETSKLGCHLMAPCEVILCQPSEIEHRSVASVASTIFFKDRNGKSHYSLFPFHLFACRGSKLFLQSLELLITRMESIWNDEYPRNESDIKWLLIELNKLLASGGILLRLKHQMFGNKIVRITQIMAADLDRMRSKGDYANQMAELMMTDSVIGKLSDEDLNQIAGSSDGSLIDSCLSSVNSVRYFCPMPKVRSVTSINDPDTLEAMLKAWRRDGSKLIAGNKEFPVPWFAFPITTEDDTMHYLPAITIVSPSYFEQGDSGEVLYRRSKDAETIDAVAFLSCFRPIPVTTRTCERPDVHWLQYFFPTITAQLCKPVVDSRVGVELLNRTDLVLP